MWLGGRLRGGWKPKSPYLISTFLRRSVEKIVWDGFGGFKNLFKSEFSHLPFLLNKGFGLKTGSVLQGCANTNERARERVQLRLQALPMWEFSLMPSFHKSRAKNHIICAVFHLSSWVLEEFNWNSRAAVTLNLIAPEKSVGPRNLNFWPTLYD